MTDRFIARSNQLIDFWDQWIGIIPFSGLHSPVLLIYFLISPFFSLSPVRCVDKLFVEEENWESAVAEWEWACRRCVHNAGTNDMFIEKELGGGSVAMCDWACQVFTQCQHQRHEDKLFTEKRAGRVPWSCGNELVESTHSASPKDVKCCFYRGRDPGGCHGWIWASVVSAMHSTITTDLWTNCLQRKNCGGP